MDWLVRGGVAESRPEAQVYGARLLQGGVLQQLGHQGGFRDDPALLYCFTQGEGPLPGETSEETPASPGSPGAFDGR